MKPDFPEHDDSPRRLLLDDIYFNYWEARMKQFLRFMDICLRKSVEDGYEPPTVTKVETNETRLKPQEEFDHTELSEMLFNSLALNAISKGVTDTDWRRISECETAKEALDILIDAYDDTPTVKYLKLQMLEAMYDGRV